MQNREALVPVTKHGEEPLRRKHARFDPLPKEMDMQYWEAFLDQSLKLLRVILFVCCRLESEELFLPGTDADISGVASQGGVHSPAVDAVWACRARSAPGDRRSASTARGGRTLLRLASASAEITPMPLTSFTYV